MNFIPATLTIIGAILIIGATGAAHIPTIIITALLGFALVGIAALIQTAHDRKRRNQP